MSLDTAIIQQYYAGILRLTPSAATINAYAQLPSYEAAMDAMMNAAVSSVNPITKLYQAAFDRVPDSTGLTNYTAAYGAGVGTMTLQQIANQWTSTIEFTTDYPASMPNADYVGLLYWNVLHRSADPVGAANFTNALNSGKMTRADVLLELSQSPEFALRIDGHIRGFQEQSALNDPAAYTGTLWDKVPPGPGESFTLTTGIDNFAATTDNATFSAITGDITAGKVTSTLNTGDILAGASGINTLSILGNGNAGGNPLVQTSNIQTVTVRGVAAAGSTVDQLLMAGVERFSSDASLADVLVVDAQLGTTYGLHNTVNTANNNADLNVTYQDTGAAADIAKLSVNNAGNATFFQDVVVNGSAANSVEAVTLATAGLNNIALDAQLGVKTFTITGAGDNTIDFAGAAATATIDASATTADQDYDVSGFASNLTVKTGAGNDVVNFGTTLTTNDSYDAGAGNNTLIATLATGMLVRPTVTNVQNVVVDFTAAGTLQADLIKGTTNYNISGSTANANVTKVASTVTDLAIDATNAGTLSFGYASGTANALAVAIGDVGTAKVDGVAVNVNGAVTLGTVQAVTVNSIGDAANTFGSTGGLTAASATSLTLNTDSKTSDLTVGALTAGKLAALELNATAGDISVGALATATKLETLTVNATDVAAIIVDDIGGTKEAVALTDISVAVGSGALTIGDIKASTVADGSALTSVAYTLAGGTSTTDQAVDIGLIAADEATINTYSFTAGDYVDADTKGVQSVTAAALGAVTLQVGDNGLATFAAFEADSITSVDVTSGKGSVLEVGSLTDTAAAGGTAVIGDVVAQGAGDVIFADIDAASVALFDASLLTGKITANLSNVDTGTTIVIGAGGTILTTGAAQGVLGTAGADNITDGKGNSLVGGSLGVDLIDISAGGSDVINLYNILSAANYDEVTGFAVANDKVQVKTADITAGNATFQAAAAVGAVTWTTNAKGVLDYQFDMTVGTALGTDGTALLANAGGAITVAANGDSGYILAYQNGNAYLYFGDAGVNTGLAANEIALVGVFNNVAVDGFTAGNFQVIA